MEKKISNKQLVEKILVTMEELVAKLKVEGRRLDEYQKVQVVQALVMGKKKLVELLGKMEGEELTGLESRLEKMEREVKELVVSVDYEEVQEILETLGTGLAKLVARSEKKN